MPGAPSGCTDIPTWWSLAETVFRPYRLGNGQSMEDNESRRGDDKADQDLPGTVSDQNAEEQPGPGTDSRPRRGASEGEDKPSGGESGEGSQSTGHPDSAG